MPEADPPSATQIPWHGHPAFLLIDGGPSEARAAAILELGQKLAALGLRPILVGPDPARLATRFEMAHVAGDAESFLTYVTEGRLKGIDRLVWGSGPGALTQKALDYGAAVAIDLRGEKAGLGQLSDWPGGEVPPLTLITSVFRAEAFLSGFFDNIAALEDYDGLCHHHVVVSDLSAAERAPLAAHCAAHDNVLLIWHRTDPGLYECWNISARLSESPYLSNANVDDLRHPRQARALVSALEEDPEAVVAATALLPFDAYTSDWREVPKGRGWYSNQAGRFHQGDLGWVHDDAEGGHRVEPHNMPHCMPVWRRDLHETNGWFDEARYGTFADWAFWLAALREGRHGVMLAEALSFYFVNPTSHNRRGDKLAAWHAQVCDDFVDEMRGAAPRPAAPREAAARNWPRKLLLSGQGQTFGMHRNAFNRVVSALEPLDAGLGGTLFLPFLERTFVWGTDPGEAASKTPRPLVDPWIGILHVPFDAPNWFHPSIHPEQVLASEMWRASRAACRGIIGLCEDLATDLSYALPDIPILAARHPTELDVRRFDPAAWRARKRLVQAGDWLRKLQAIIGIEAPGYQKIMLLKASTETFLRHDIAANGAMPAWGDTERRQAVSNEEYDELLTGSVVLCMLYGTAANNLVIECMVRATPIVVNPLPAVVEYLGRGYPLYAETLTEAGSVIGDEGRVLAAHEWLLDRTPKVGISYRDFLRQVAGSELYRAL